MGSARRCLLELMDHLRARRRRPRPDHRHAGAATLVDPPAPQTHATPNLQFRPSPTDDDPPAVRPCPRPGIQRYGGIQVPLGRHRLGSNHSGAGRNSSNRSAGTAFGSVIPAQAGIQRSCSAGTAPDPVAGRRLVAPSPESHTQCRSTNAAPPQPPHLDSGLRRNDERMQPRSAPAVRCRTGSDHPPGDDPPAHPAQLLWQAPPDPGSLFRRRPESQLGRHCAPVRIIPAQAAQPRQDPCHSGAGRNPVQPRSAAVRQAPPPDPSFRRRPDSSATARQAPPSDPSFRRRRRPESSAAAQQAPRQILSRRRLVAPRPSRIHSAAQQTQCHPNRRILDSGLRRNDERMQPRSAPAVRLPHRLRHQCPPSRRRPPPAQAGIQRSRSAGTAPDPVVRHSGAGRTQCHTQRIRSGERAPRPGPSFRRRPESSAAARQAPPPDPSFRRRPESSVASLSEHGRPGNSTRPRPRLAADILRATSRARRTAYPTPAPHPLVTKKLE